MSSRFPSLPAEAVPDFLTRNDLAPVLTAKGELRVVPLKRSGAVRIRLRRLGALFVWVVTFLAAALAGIKMVVLVGS